MPCTWGVLYGFQVFKCLKSIRSSPNPCLTKTNTGDEFAAQPERAHRASSLDCGVSPWNVKPKPEPSAAYWSPLRDPEPPETPHHGTGPAAICLASASRNPAPRLRFGVAITPRHYRSFRTRDRPPGGSDGAHPPLPKIPERKCC